VERRAESNGNLLGTQSGDAGLCSVSLLYFCGTYNRNSSRSGSRYSLRSGGFGVFYAREGGGDDGGDAAAGAEVAYDDCPDWVAGFDYVVEDLVDDVFLEDAEVAVGEEVLLEGFELEAALAGHVADGEASEVGEAGLRADAGELGVVDQDLVGLELVLPGFDGGEGGVEAGFGVVVGVAGGVRGGDGRGAHASILACLARVLLGWG
jgi:hypothetical protein